MLLSQETCHACSTAVVPQSMSEIIAGCLEDLYKPKRDDNIYSLSFMPGFPMYLRERPSNTVPFRRQAQRHARTLPHARADTKKFHAAISREDSREAPSTPLAIYDELSYALAAGPSMLMILQSSKIPPPI